MTNKKSINALEILKEAFEIVKRNSEIIELYVLQFIIVIITMISLLGLPIFLKFIGAGFLAKSSILTTQFLHQYLYALITAITIIFIIQLTITGAVISLVASIKRGRKISISKALKIGLNRVPYLIAGAIVTSFVVGMGLIALIIPGLYLLVRLLLFQQACVIDGSIGVKKSWEVTKGRFWDVAVILIVLFSIAFGISLFPYIGPLINSLLITPLAVTTWTLVYLKIRK